MIAPQKKIHFDRFEFKKWASIDTETIVEAPVSLTINGEPWVTSMCTPTDLEAMAVGFLYNEGVIDRRDEIADVRLCEHGDNVDVWLTRPAERPRSWRRTSGCTGGVTAVDHLAIPNVSFDPEYPRLDPEAVGALVEQLFELSSPLSRNRRGAHLLA